MPTPFYERIPGAGLYDLTITGGHAPYLALIRRDTDGRRQWQPADGLPGLHAAAEAILTALADSKLRHRGERPLVVVESPYAGDVARNVAYARAAMRDSLRRGEYPIASHLLYTQVLDDTDPQERELGIQAGLAWAEEAALTAVYTDLGMSRGMAQGVEDAQQAGRAVDYRKLPGWEAQA